MGITARSGPQVTYGITPTSTGTGLGGVTPPGEYNEERGPSVTDLGQGIMDPRTAYCYKPGAPVGTPLGTFYNNRAYVDTVPLTAQTAAFVSTTTVSTGVSGSFTLNSASTALGTYSVSINPPEGGAAVTLLTFDSSQSQFLTFGSGGTVACWNPTQMLGRCISITTSSSGDTGTWSVYGRDIYGYKMTETLAITEGSSQSSGYVITGKKAFKYISAIANTTTPVSTNVSFGFSDKFGMPWAVSYCGHDLTARLLASAYSSVAAVLMSSANFVLASTAATATSTTPDARGTYTSSTASNGTLRVQIAVTLAASAAKAITAADVSPMFGVAQYSSI